MFELPSNDRIREADLVIPALVVLAPAKRHGTGAVVISDLERDIGTALPLRPVDLEVTSSDTVTRFQRTARNLISHQTLVKKGLAEDVKGLDPARSYLEITPKGMGFLFDHMVGMFADQVPDIADLKKAEPEVAAVPGQVRQGASSLKDVALLVLGILQHKNEGQPVDASLLRRGIKALAGKAFDLSEADLELEGQPGQTGVGATTRFDRVVRNLLISHQTLTKSALAEKTDVGFSLTEEGKARLVMDNLLAHAPAPPSVQRALKEAAAVPPENPRRSGPRP